MHQLYYLNRDLVLKDAISQPQMQLEQLPPLILKTSLKRGLPTKENLLDAAFYLEMITAQKAIGCRAKKSAANFRVRKSDIIGWQVTLRGPKLNYFLSKWSNYVLPLEEDINKIPNLASFLELNELILPDQIIIHVSFESKDRKFSDLLLSGLNIPFARMT